MEWVLGIGLGLLVVAGLISFAYLMLLAAMMSR